jgi:hypothetical protein
MRGIIVPFQVQIEVANRIAHPSTMASTIEREGIPARGLVMTPGTVSTPRAVLTLRREALTSPGEIEAATAMPAMVHIHLNLATATHTGAAGLPITTHTPVPIHTVRQVLRATYMSARASLITTHTPALIHMILLIPRAMQMSARASIITTNTPTPIHTARLLQRATPVDVRDLLLSSPTSIILLHLGSNIRGDTLLATGMTMEVNIVRHIMGQKVARTNRMMTRSMLGPHRH